MADGREFRIVAPLLHQLNGDLTLRHMRNLSLLGFDSITVLDSLTLKDVDFGDNTSASVLGKDQFSSTTQLYNLTLIDTNVTGVEWSLESMGLDAWLFVYAHGNKRLTNITFTGLSTNGNGIQIDVADNAHSMGVHLPDATTLAPRISDIDSFTNIGIGKISPPSDDLTLPLYFSHNSFQVLDLNQVGEIEGNFRIEDNRILEQLRTENLGIVDSLVVISGNDQLTTLQMSHLQTVTGRLDITAPLSGAQSIGSTTTNGGGRINITAYGSPNVDCKKLRETLSVNVTCTNKPASEFTNPSPSSVSHGPTEPATGSSGLSTGAKAGIGVGVGLGVLAIIGALIFCLCVRRRKKSRGTNREVAAEYSKAQQGDGASNSTSPISYSKVPYQSTAVDDSQEQQSSRRPQSSLLGDEWTPPEQTLPSTEGRMELEEQQGIRHEMDARSLPDMDLDDGDEEDTRSLNDIERIHAQR